MADAPSHVYILNTTTVAIALRVNNFDAGTVPAGAKDSAHGFVPGVLKVPRSSAPAPGDASFGSGSGANANTMEVTTPGARTLYHGIAIDPRAYPLNRDLQMYVFYSAAVLCESGVVLWGASDPTDAQYPADIRPM